MNDYLDTVVQGDCLEVLRELPDCSVELCATDPPFGIAFMSKTWDSDIPARAIWAEVLRVLKPGASCFVCAGSRQDTILGMLLDLREVGFDIQHAALSWVYWNGFPKSSCVSKQCDKAAFLTWLRETPEGETETRQALMGWDAADVRKAASAAVNGCYSAEPSHDAKRAGARGSMTSIADNVRPWNDEAAAGHPGTGTLLLTALQARFGDAPGVRAKAADYMAPRQVERGTYRSEWTESIGGDSTGAFCASDGLAKHSTSPTTPDAVKWDGWHSGSVPLKPSAEQILWVTKPAEPGPARNNVLKWGTGACNIGECRVPIVGDDIINTATHSAERHNASPCYGDSSADWTTQQHPSGRYPSNLLVSSRALGDDSKYGDLDAWAAARGLSDEWLDAALSAGVLRVPKPSRSEKNAGCDGLEEREPLGSKRSNPAPGRELPLGRPRSNHHPTTKPVTLMAFLCTLACPKRVVDLVCDTCYNTSTKASGGNNSAPEDLSGMQHDVSVQAGETNLLLEDVQRYSKPQASQDVSCVRGAYDEDGAPVLLKGMHERRTQGAQACTDTLVRTMRETIPSHSEQRGSLLQPGLQRESDRTCQKETTNLRGQRVLDGLRAREPDGDEERVCDGTQAGDGAAPAEAAREDRGSASHQRGQGRQSDREPRTNETGGAQSSSETEEVQDHRMPALCQDDTAQQFCPKCGKALKYRWRAGIVLDPFLGSGTTAVAAVQCGMHYIGIEREPEYVAIAEARIAAAFRDRQPTLALEAAE